MDIEDVHEDSDGSSQRSTGAAPVVRSAIVWFQIGGLLRFLSHAETLRMFQRACARAGLPVKHTAGFNPHPRLSLPLPRSVGVESDGEVLVVALETGSQTTAACSSSREADEARLRQELQARLPAGIEVLRVELVDAGVSFHASSADYVFRYGPDADARLVERVGRRIEAVMADTSVVVERRLPGDRKARRIDVRPFLEAIRAEQDGVRVTCNVTAAGSIRIAEILQLLELNAEDLTAPVRRTAVHWAAT